MATITLKIIIMTEEIITITQDKKTEIRLLEDNTAIIITILVAIMNRDFNNQILSTSLNNMGK
jgi:hypothetical protein